MAPWQHVMEEVIYDIAFKVRHVSRSASQNHDCEYFLKGVRNDAVETTVQSHDSRFEKCLGAQDGTPCQEVWLLGQCLSPFDIDGKESIAKILHVCCFWHEGTVE